MTEHLMQDLGRARYGAASTASLVAIGSEDYEAKDNVGRLEIARDIFQLYASIGTTWQVPAFDWLDAHALEGPSPQDDVQMHVAVFASGPRYNHERDVSQADVSVWGSLQDERFGIVVPWNFMARLDYEGNIPLEWITGVFGMQPLESSFGQEFVGYVDQAALSYLNGPVAVGHEYRDEHELKF